VILVSEDIAGAWKTDVMCLISCDCKISKAAAFKIGVGWYNKS
jgi:hypothetical protein